MHEDDLCVLRIVRSVAGEIQALRFEASTFENVLRQAAEAGALKTSALEKQIAFLSRALPDRSGSTDDAPDSLASSVRRSLLPDSLFPDLASSISALVHATQWERGMSSLFVSSNGRLLGQELRAQWQSTDHRRADLVLFRNRNGAKLPPGLMMRLDRAERMISEISAGRDDVAQQRVTPSDIIDRYSAANVELLSVIDALASTAVATPLRPTALAWMALLHAKEKTGIERAHLASAFAWDRYVEGQYAKVSALIAASDSYLHMFAVAAPGSAGEMLRATLKSAVADTVTEMERVALHRSQGGFGIDPTDWFDNVSRKMELLEDVESAVRASITNGRA